MHSLLTASEDPASSLLSLRQVLAHLRQVHQTHAPTPAVQINPCEASTFALVVAQCTPWFATPQQPLLVLTPTEERALQFVQDLQFFLNVSSRADENQSLVLHLPDLDWRPWDDVVPDRRLQMQRMAALFRLSQGEPPAVVVASIPAFSRRVMPKTAFSSLVDILQVEQEISRDATVQFLVQAGYTRTPVCEDPGTFSVHGGVLDVFVPLYDYPARISLYGDWIESIRLYDPSSQRALRPITELMLHPIRETVRTPGNRFREQLLDASDAANHPSSKTRDLLERLEEGELFVGVDTLTPAFHASMAPLTSYLSATTPVFVLNPTDCQDAWLSLEVQGEAAYQQRLQAHKLAFPPEAFYLSLTGWHTWYEASQRLRVEAGGLLLATAEPPLALCARNHADVMAAVQAAQRQQTSALAPWAQRLTEQIHSGMHTTVVVPNLQHAERLDSLLRPHALAPAIHRPGIAPLAALQETGHTLEAWDVLRAPSPHLLEIRMGALSQGFDLPLDGISLYAESEIFGEKVKRSAAKSKPKRNTQEWTVGTLVVHQLHGIGRYQGFSKFPTRNQTVDVVHIQYDGGSLYLPVWRLHELQRHQGADTSLTKLDKLGGETWQRTRTKVARDVQRLAEELLQLYAQRKALPGTSHRLDETAQTCFAAFEAQFPYEETPDQQKAIDEVRLDLDAEHPMDRLICGDVGYGKTEVALRAAMKVALAGKQVALLAPTTVLVEQHAARFAQRFAGFPVKVASLSRFRSSKEQLEVIKQLANGQLDVVIGTHRLLSADVRFQRLGLLIIDEEQRFGVAHKERLRQLRTQLDTLTLTATPIPRTLQMTLSGMREISLITTPPEDRLAIRTMVARESNELIREGILQEIRRGGQVFFVHNRVETIGKWARTLHELVPDLKIGVGHGQLSPEALEKVMLDFVSGHTQVLLCTTIVESGIDIPRANTMFVDRADTFGLSQLYQLRGRIGRSKERAFCYLLVPPQESMSTEAKQRLAVLQRFTELGAGFQIASHDLELRGAGELLGSKQSGSMAAVGFEMFMQMLEEAIAELRGTPIRKQRDPDLTCDLPAYLPEPYIPDPGQRIEWYQRLSLAHNEEELAQLSNELVDRYGTLPDEAHMLCDVMVVKNLARQLEATAVELSETRLALALSEKTPLTPAFVLKLVQTPKSPWRLTPDMRLSRQWVTPQEKQDRLRFAKAVLNELLRENPPLPS